MQGSISISRPKAQLNPIQKGLAVLRKYGANAHMWLPGVGYLNGQQLGNWTDSAGSIAASVDNPVGFVIDQGIGASAILQDLTRNNDFSSGATYWTPGSGWTVSTGSATHASAGGASALTQSGLIIGNFYKMTIYSPNPVGFNALFGGNYVTINWVGNVGTAFGACTVNGNFGVQGGGDITITRIVCQQVLDALSPELSLQTSNFTSTSGFTAGNATLSTVGGNLVLTSTVASGAMSLSFGGGAVSGSTYRGSMTVVSNTAQNSAWYFGGVQASPGNITLTGGTGSASAIQTGNSTQSAFALQWVVTAIGQQVVISAVSIKLVLGIFASQATTANKPTLRRGMTNLLQYSADFTNAAWSKANSSISSGVTDPTGGSSAVKLVSSSTTNGMYVRQSGTFSFVGNTPYTVAAIVKADGFNQAYVMGYDGGGDRGAVFDLTTGTVTNAYSSPTQSSLSLGNGWWLCVINITPQTTPTASLMGVRLAQGGAPGSVTGDGIKGIDLYRAALFQGTFTATQILKCGGIPLTTTASVSTLVGNYGWELNGTNTYLTTSSVPFQYSDDHCVIVGSTLKDPSISRAGLFVTRNSTTTNPIGCELAFVTGFAQARWRSDGGVVTQLAGAVNLAGKPTVMTARVASLAATLRVNGSQVASGALFNATSSVNITTFGCGSNGAGSYSDFGSGVANIIVAIKGTPSDSDLLALERFVGALTGPTGVSF